MHFIDCLDSRHPSLERKFKTKPDGRGPFPKEEVDKPLILKNVPRKFSRYGIPVPLFLQELGRIPTPDLVLVSCTMTYWYPGIQQVVELIRNKFGQVPVVLGGVYATLMPEHARTSSGADVIFQGLGEESLVPLVRDILGSIPSSEIECNTMNEVPWPSFDLLRRKDVLPVLTSRGCPFCCSFCASPLLYRNFEQRQPASVVSEIDHHYRKWGVRHLAFYDDALLLNRRDHIIPLLKEIIRKELPVFFHTPNGLHVKEVDSELAFLFRKANFQSLFLSQESLDSKVLAKAGSKVSEADLKKAMNHLEKAGYRRREINVYLMLGLPGQSISGIKESIRHVQSLGAAPRLTYFSPVPGTREWEDLVEKGKLTPDADPLFHNKIAFNYLAGEISPQDLRTIGTLASGPDAMEN
ncbi:MAG: radical SAM protein [Candidatus Aminicenantes bacterium]